MSTKESSASRYLNYALLVGLAAIVVVPAFMRGMFFREDFLRYFSAAGGFSIFFAVVALLQRRPIWHLDVDLALLGVSALYGLTILWAKSKGAATDGALKYAVYLLSFLIARYLAQEEHGQSAIHAAIIASAIVASGVGFLAAAGKISYADAVIGGRLSGSFQYPNSLGAYAMFAWFLTLFWRYRASQAFTAVLLSAAGFLMLLVIVLSYSRGTWLVFAFITVLYFALLPRQARFRVALGTLISGVPVLAVNVPLSAAIRKPDAPAVSTYLIAGLAMTIVLESVRIVAVRYIARTSVSPGKTPGLRGNRGRRTVLILVAVLVLAVTAILVWTPAGRRLSQRISPPSFWQRLASIGLRDPSLLSRAFATWDAFAIALDNPFGAGAGGWNLLYRQYQRSLYTYTETHNQFAQVLVEVGFPGLVLYAVFWGGAAYSLFRAWKEHKSGLDRGPETGDRFLRVLTTGAAVWALGLHSAIDFDMSLPAVSVPLFVALGTLMAETSPTREGATKTSPLGRSHTLPTSGILILQAVSIVAIAILVLVPSRRHFHGMVLGSQGVDLLTDNKIQQGRELLIAAIGEDACTASYPLDVAQTFAQEYLGSQENGPRSMASMYLDLALKKDPYNLDVAASACDIFYSMGAYDRAAELARDMAKRMPFDRSAQQHLAMVLRAAFLTHASSAIAADGTSQRQQDLDAARKYAAQAEQIPVDMQATRGRATGIYAQAFNPATLNVTPGIQMVLGQVAFLNGDLKTAAKNLSVAATDPACALEANTWLYSLSKVGDIGTTAPKGAGFEQASLVIVPMFGLIK